MKSNEEFIRDLKRSQGDKFTPLESYKGNTVKIKFKCNICNNIWSATPANIYKKIKNCPECSKEAKVNSLTSTNDEFILKAKSILGKKFYDYEILSEYKKSNLKIKVKHKECGHIWEITPNNFIRIVTCPKCHGKVDGKVSETNRMKSQKSNQYFLNKLKEVLGDEYLPLEAYKGYNYKILVEHTKCGHKWKVRAGTLVRGHGCPKCAGNYKRTTDDAKKEILKKFDGKIELISEFKTVKASIKLKCNVCGEIFTKNAGYLLNNKEAKGCPYCSPTSSGEEIIRDYLRNEGINYYTQEIMKKGDKTLFYDFGVFKDGKLLAFIEYQGIQHYKPVDFFGGEEQLKKQKENDFMKIQYAKENNIPLICIPYWERDNIENILNQELFDIGIKGGLNERLSEHTGGTGITRSDTSG